MKNQAWFPNVLHPINLSFHHSPPLPSNFLVYSHGMVWIIWVSSKDLNNGELPPQSLLLWLINVHG